MTGFDNERFISEIKNRPAIWNSACDEYSNRELKRACWEEMVKIFSENDDMTNEDKRELENALHKRWKCLRGCFTRELNRQKSLKYGLDVGPRKSEYIYFKQMKFLTNVVALRESILHPVDFLECVHSDEENRAPKRRNSDNTLENSQAEESEEQDEDKLFLLSLLSSLKKVPESKKMSTKIRIMSLLDQVTQNADYDEVEIEN